MADVARKVPRSALLDGLALLAVSFLLALTCSVTPWRTLQPLTDSSVFRYVALVMERGGMPYLDTFDHKGPLVYLVNRLGMRLSFWRGIWALEFTALLVAVAFMYLAARLFVGRARAHAVVFAACSLLGAYLQGGNLVEEWALPFISFSTWSLLKLAREGRVAAGVTVATGACCGAVLLLRPNMVAVWAVYACAAVWVGIGRRNPRMVAREALLFLGGLAAILAPVVCWIWARGALPSFVDDYLVFNFVYSGSDGGSALGKMRLRVAALMFFAVDPVVCSAAVLAALGAGRRERGAAVCLAALALSLLTTALSGHQFGHYGMVLLPPVAACLACGLAPHGGEGDAGLSYPAVPAAVLASVLVISVVPAWRDVVENALDQHPFAKQEVVRGEAGEAVAMVVANTEEGDLITVCGNVDAVYLASGRMSASTFSYQIPLGRVDGSIVDRYFAELDESPPSAIVLREGFYPMDRILSFIEEHGYSEAGTTSEGWATVWVLRDRGSVGRVGVTGLP